MPSKQSQKNNRASIRQVSWGDVRKEVQKVNPEFCQAIDGVSPDKNHTLYKARFPYGYEFLRNGKLYLPDDQGNMKLFSASGFDRKMQEDLGYTGKVPMLLVLNGCCEVYTELLHRTVAYMVSPSDILTFLGLWRVLTKPPLSQHPPFLWTMSSGVRSIFLLPKISVTKKHKRLVELYGIDSNVPKHLADHGKLFHQLANSLHFGETWFSEILFFSYPWFEHFEDPAWMPFNYYILQKGWHSSEYWRNEFVWNMMVSIIQENKNLKPDPYMADTVRHLFAMALGAYPGFGVATDDSMAPISRLQEIYMEDYGLDQYAPLILEPHYFNMYHQDQAIYYSLEYPTTALFSPKARRETTKMVELKDIQYLLKKYLEEMAGGYLNLQGSPQGELSERVRFDCFHTQEILSDCILNAEDISKEDLAIKRALEKFSGCVFPGKSAFWRGSVRISNRDEE